MNISLETPALIFPAISLLMLAYTNRFVVLADLIRNLYEVHQNDPSDTTLAQIENLQKRMQIIKIMQVLGASSFILAILSIILNMLNLQEISWIIFLLSLIVLLLSLIYLLKELFISIEALTIQLDDLKKRD